MASKIDIISRALLLLGHDTINSLNDPGRVVRVAVNLYDDIKETELESSNWTFAKFKAQLAKLTTPPIDEFESAYQLPSDLLKVLKIKPRVNYKIYQDQLYTNETGTIFIDYIANIGEDRFSSSFTRMLELALANNYSIPIKEEVTTSQILEDRYRKARNRALKNDSSQAPQDPIASSPFIAARLGGNRGIGGGL